MAALDFSDIEFDPGDVVDVLRVANLCHFTDAASSMRSRIDAALATDVQVENCIAACPIRTSATRFTIDAEGDWGIVAACYRDDGSLIDAAAFDAEGATRRTLRGRAWALNPGAVLDARLDNMRVRAHAGVWSWLSAGCRGLLVLDWRQAAMALIERRVAALVADDVAQGRRLRESMADVHLSLPISIDEQARAV